MGLDGLAASLVWHLGGQPGAGEGVRSVRRIPADCRSRLYTSNRVPLLPSPLVKLPIGQITPKGWLRNMLEIEAEGLTGRLAELSPWLRLGVKCLGRP